MQGNNLRAKIEVAEWFSRSIGEIGDRIKTKVTSERAQIELFNEIAGILSKHAVKVQGPVYLDSYNHDLGMTTTSNSEEIISVYQERG